MKHCISEHAWEDDLYWYTTDKKTARRITSEHRIVYSVTDTAVYIAQIRYHYRD